MTASQIILEVKHLPFRERLEVIEQTLRHLTREERKPIERLLRRLQYPDIPDSFWSGVEDHEDDRTVDMEIALHEKPPEQK